MTDLNLDPDYPSHPKTKKLVSILGREAEILPIRLWCWAAKYRPADGDLSNCTVGEIETNLNWWGRPRAAVAALVRAGFLEKILPNGDKKSTRTRTKYAIHAWSEKQGHIQALRSRNLKVAQNRWEKLKKPCTTDTRDAPLVDQNSTTGVPYTNHTNHLEESGATCDASPQDHQTRGTVTPKSRAEVIEYFASLAESDSSEAEQFYDHYEANGWVQGKGKPIKNWKAAARNWMRRKGKYSSHQRGTQTARKPELVANPDSPGEMTATQKALAGIPQ